MRRNRLILSILIVGCVLLLHVGCQEQRKVPEEPKTVLVEPGPEADLSDSARLEPPPAEAKTIETKVLEVGPRIKFEKVVHDFGEVKRNSSNVCEFRFANVGDAVLKIERIISGCRCTVPELAKKEYAPGESGTLKVVYRASSRPGSATRRVSVPSNDKTKPNVVLTVKARVPTIVVHKPNELKLMVRGGTVSCPEITLTSVDGQPFSIKSFGSPRNCITGSFDSSKSATEFVLQPEVHLERLNEKMNGNITIGLTHPESGMIVVPFSRLPPFKVTPSSIVVHNAEPQKPIRKEVLILNSYGDNFEIESTSSEKDVVKVLHQKKLGSRCQLDLEIIPPAADDNQGVFTDVLFVNMKGGEKLEINCRGFYSKG